MSTRKMAEKKKQTLLRASLRIVAILVVSLGLSLWSLHHASASPASEGERIVEQDVEVKPQLPSLPLIPLDLSGSIALALVLIEVCGSVAPASTDLRPSCGSYRFWANSLSPPL